MEIKNTYKSKIFDKRLPGDIFFASIDNNTHNTDTLSKTIHPRFVQFYFCLQGTVTFHFSERYSKVLEEGNSFLIYHPEHALPLQISMAAKSKLKILVISIKELHQLFSTEIFQDLFQDTHKNVHEEQLISPDIHQLFSFLEQLNISHRLEDLYWKNKITEMVLLYFSNKMDSQLSCPFLENEEEAFAVRTAKDYLLGHLKEGFKIADIADKFGLSEYKLKENFKKMYGSTISKYVLQHRMERGKEEIEKRQKKIKEIALDLGYENPSHFIEAFRKYYGITPKQYEKKISA